MPPLLFESSVVSVAVVTVRHLNKSFTTAGKSFTAVDRLSFDVMRGECFGLLGPNGAGKSTTMKMLLGLTPADSGTIELLGFQIPAQARVARYKIGVVPQMDSLDPDFTVQENLRIYGGYFGLSADQMTKRLPSLLEFAQLENKKDANIRELSGGMKRRLTIARAMVNDPEILVLDEPTTGLDPQARHLIWDRLKKLRASGKTIVLTTHFMDEAERLCDRLAIVDHGQKIAQDSPAELIKNEISPFVIELTGDGLADWTAANKTTLNEASKSFYRFEHVGDTGYIYCDAPSKVLTHLQLQSQTPGVRAIQRNSNLEDVFLKLTGRDLRD
jgi:lipooligosaccharide transport system ATP-binding protein